MPQTEINCNLCQSNIVFNIEDDSTYINKTEKGTFYGTEIAVYRVSHLIEDKKHINAVIVDKKGFYRGFVDSYLEEIETKGESYRILGKDASNLKLEKNNMFGAFIFINTKSKLIIDSFNDQNLKIIELSEIVIQRVKEASRIYKTQPEYYKLAIADKKFLVWIKEHIIVALSIKRLLRDKSNDINKLVKEIFSYLLVNDLESVNIRIFSIIMKIIEKLDIEFNDEDIEYLRRLLSDESLYFMFNVKVNLGDIMKFVNNTFSLDGGLLLKLFQGDASILDLLLLDDDNLKLYKELIKLMDFLDRRKIINVIDN